MSAPAADRSFFAAFLDLRDRPVLVVGGGEVAQAKAEALLRSGAKVTVVAPRLGARLAEWVGEGAVAHRARAFEAADLAGMTLAIAATDDRMANAAVAAAARALHVPVNVADAPSLSTFIMPSVVYRGPVQVAVSTAGASPVLARRLAARVAAAIGPEFGELARLAADYREAAKERFPDLAGRRAFWERVIDGPVGREALAGRLDQARRMLEEELSGGQGPRPKRVCPDNP